MNTKKLFNQNRSRVISVLIALLLTAVFSLSATLAWENIGQRAFNVTYEANYSDVIVEKRIAGENALLPGAEFVIERWEFIEYDEDEDEVWGWVQVRADIFGVSFLAPTFTTDENGQFLLPQLPVGEYRLVEIDIPTGFGLVNNNPYTEFTLTFNAENEIVVLVGNEVVDLVVVYNERLFDELAVDKIVINADGSELTDAQRELQFTFDVEFRDAAGYVLPAPHSFVIYRDGVLVTEPETEWLTTSAGLFQLRHGERAVFRDLPIGITYVVNETLPFGFDVVGSGTAGIIVDQRAADELLNHANFTNTYRLTTVEPAAGYLVINKFLIGEFTSDGEQNPDLDADAENDDSDQVTLPVCFIFTIRIGDYEFEECIVPGTPWVSARFPVGTPFEVIEHDYSHFGIVVENNNVTGQIIAGQNVVTVINHVQPDLTGYGEVVVTKYVTGVGYDPESLFRFTITLENLPIVLVPVVDEAGNSVLDENNEPVYAIADVTILINGEQRVISAPFWEEDFDLPAGGTATLSQIPAGTQVTVYEHYKANFIQGLVSTTGVIVGNGSRFPINFVNHYRPGEEVREVGRLEVCKVLTDLSDAPDTPFTFHLYLDDQFERAFTVYANACATINNLPIGVLFRVTEPLELIPSGFVFERSFGEFGTVQEFNHAVFINSRAYVEIPVEKLWNFNGLTNLELPEYIVIYLLANGSHIQVATIRPDADGNWQHTFRARLNDASNDEIVYTVVERPNTGWLEQVEPNPAGGFTITNNVLVPIVVDGLWVEKVLIGNPTVAPVFEFTMTPLRDAPMPEPSQVSVTRAGYVQFGQITFTEPGVFEYVVREVIPADQGDFSFDVSVFIVTFTVTATTNGQLMASGPVMTVAGNTVENIVFTNRYDPCPSDNCPPCPVDFEFTKVNANSGAPLAGANFSLYARDAAGTGWALPAIQTAISAANGQVIFTELTPGNQYRLVETSAPTGFVTPSGYWVITVSNTGVITITTHGTNQPSFTNNNTVVANTPLPTPEPGEPGGGGNQPGPGEPGGGGNQPEPDAPSGDNNQPGPSTNRPGTGGNQPQTSDEAQLHFWTTIMIISGVALLVYAPVNILIQKRKQN